MEKQDNSQANDTLPTSFQMVIGESSSNTNNQMVDYMVNSHSTQQQQQQQRRQQQQNQGLLGFLPSNSSSSSLDKLSFADVMQFADFGPKLALNQTKVSEEDGGIDPVYFLKFPVLNEKNDDDGDGDDDEALMLAQGDDQEKFKLVVEGGDGKEKGDTNIVERSIGNHHHEVGIKNNKRKRPRIKTSEEVESQRMTHIAVERNRRKQMNEHLRVLRSLMPGSYVQRGDQASIIGGAIEFVRELEQLLQCLESQKRRRIYGDNNNNNNTPTRPLGDSSNNNLPINHQNPNNQPPLLFPLPNEYIIEGGNIQEEMAESKSCLADVEVKILGFDAMIKILSRRRPGQLIKAIAALEDMQLSILHTNITTIEQTVLYSFNVKISGETRYTADDIANSIQQIFSFIHAEITPYDVN